MIGFLLFFNLLSCNKAESALKTITVYRSPHCGCCKKWESHLEANGFKVRSEVVNDLSSVKEIQAVPPKLKSCHTAVINGYLIEGHVPADAIEKLLKEAPKDILGLSVPGMPMGSPGMEGAVNEKFDVISFDASGKDRVFQ
ncbi:MAG: DUF411 domain-containing protein [Bacteriovoracaceae bacterium]|nr:DUF411 domain-containing protein [Bacteriovoracaceae bacterium]